MDGLSNELQLRRREISDEGKGVSMEVSSIVASSSQARDGGHHSCSLMEAKDDRELGAHRSHPIPHVVIDGSSRLRNIVEQLPSMY